MENFGTIFDMFGKSFVKIEFEHVKRFLLLIAGEGQQTLQKFLLRYRNQHKWALYTITSLIFVQMVEFMKS